jgi:hypothetical protein
MTGIDPNSAAAAAHASRSMGSSARVDAFVELKSSLALFPDAVVVVLGPGQHHPTTIASSIDRSNESDRMRQC